MKPIIWAAAGTALVLAGIVVGRFSSGAPVPTSVSAAPTLPDTTDKQGGATSRQNVALIQSMLDSNNASHEECLARCSQEAPDVERRRRLKASALEGSCTTECNLSYRVREDRIVTQAEQLGVPLQRR